MICIAGGIDGGGGGAGGGGGGFAPPPPPITVQKVCNSAPISKSETIFKRCIQPNHLLGSWGRPGEKSGMLTIQNFRCQYSLQLLQARYVISREKDSSLGF